MADSEKKENNKEEAVEQNETKNENVDESKKVDSNTDTKTDTGSKKASDEKIKTLSEVDQLKQEIVDLKEDNEELNNIRLRQTAEFDNFRKRSAKDQLRNMLSANEDLVVDFLPVFDNFERSLAEENKTDKIEDLYKGVDMIFTQFQEVLKKAGLKKDEPIGEEFNPEYHDAMLQQHSDDHDENIIMQVIMNGFKLNEKVIKHAQVIVSKGKEEK